MTKNKRGLGKGINAFFGEDPLKDIEKSISQKASDQGEVALIPLDEIRPNPYQPRIHFDEQALEELAQSIKEQGLLQPIVVRPSTMKGYEIIAGERRYRATKRLGETVIKAIFVDMTDQQMFEMAILENLQREDLTPLEEASAYHNMMSQLEMTQEDVAKRLGKSRSYIANFVRLLSLDTKVKAYLEAGDLSIGHARALLSIKDLKKQRDLAWKVIEEGLNVRQVEQLVKHPDMLKKTSQKKVPIPAEKSAQIRENEDRLMDKFGTNVTIKQSGIGGRIEIEFLNEADLTRILDILSIRLDD